MINDFETTDQLEMAYIFDLGCFPFEFNKENPKKVIMIVKADPYLVKSKLEEMWADDEKTHRFRRHINAYKAMKQALWVGGVYDRNYYNKRNANNTTPICEDVKKSDGKEVQS